MKAIEWGESFFLKGEKQPQSSKALGIQKGGRERERNFFFKKRTPTLVASKWSDLMSLK